jgi:hypothetical protein
MTLADLRAMRDNLAASENGPRFLGIPDRWFDAGLFRCINGHVSAWILKSETLGRDACLAGGCMAPVLITFPEDFDDPEVST